MPKGSGSAPIRLYLVLILLAVGAFAVRDYTGLAPPRVSQLIDLSRSTEYATLPFKYYSCIGTDSVVFTTLSYPNGSEVWAHIGRSQPDGPRFIKLGSFDTAEVEFQGSLANGRVLFAAIYPQQVNKLYSTNCREGGLEQIQPASGSNSGRITATPILGPGGLPTADARLRFEQSAVAYNGIVNGYTNGTYSFLAGNLNFDTLPREPVSCLGKIYLSLNTKGDSLFSLSRENPFFANETALPGGIPPGPGAYPANRFFCYRNQDLVGFYLADSALELFNGTHFRRVQASGISAYAETQTVQLADKLVILWRDDTISGVNLIDTEGLSNYTLRTEDIVVLDSGVVLGPPDDQILIYYGQNDYNSLVRYWDPATNYIQELPLPPSWQNGELMYPATPINAVNSSFIGVYVGRTNYYPTFVFRNRTVAQLPLPVSCQSLQSSGNFVEDYLGYFSDSVGPFVRHYTAENGSVIRSVGEDLTSTFYYDKSPGPDLDVHNTVVTHPTTRINGQGLTETGVYFSMWTSDLQTSLYWLAALFSSSWSSALTFRSRTNGNGYEFIAQLSNGPGECPSLPIRSVGFTSESYVRWKDSLLFLAYRNGSFSLMSTTGTAASVAPVPNITSPTPWSLSSSVGCGDSLYFSIGNAVRSIPTDFTYPFALTVQQFLCVNATLFGVVDNSSLGRFVDGEGFALLGTWPSIGALINHDGGILGSAFNSTAYNLFWIDLTHGTTTEFAVVTSLVSFQSVNSTHTIATSTNGTALIVASVVGLSYQQLRVIPGVTVNYFSLGVSTGSYFFFGIEAGAKYLVRSDLTVAGTAQVLIVSSTPLNYPLLSVDIESSEKGVMYWTSNGALRYWSIAIGSTVNQVAMGVPILNVKQAVQFNSTHFLVVSTKSIPHGYNTRYETSFLLAKFSFEYPSIDNSDSFTVSSPLVVANFAQLANASLLVDPGATLTVLGCATLDGTLQLNINASLQANSAVDVIYYGQCVSGTFTRIQINDQAAEGPCGARTVTATPDYGPTKLSALFVVEPAVCQSPELPVGAIAGGVVGGFVGLVVIAVVVVLAIPKARAKVFPYRSRGKDTVELNG